LLRVGFPIFDRLGGQHKLRVGYQGARDLIFEVANIFESERREPTPESLDPFRDRARRETGVPSNALWGERA
jgi:nitrogenase molybdenum-iron protein NifN